MQTSTDAAAALMSPRSTGTWPMPPMNSDMTRPRSPGVVKYSALARYIT